jgi:hypothetical protein
MLLVVRVGALAFAAAVLFLHWQRRDIDPLRRGISHYAAGPYGWLMTFGFLALASALATAAWIGNGNRSAWLWIAAGGMVGVAMTPIAPRSSPLAQFIHQAAGFAFFVAMFGVAITEWAVWPDIAIALAVPLFLASFAVARLATIAGALQRVVFALVVFWLVR